MSEQFSVVGRILREWIVWYRDGNVILEYNEDGKEVTWAFALAYHQNVSPAIRIGWVGIPQEKVDKINVHQNGVYVSLNLAAHFHEVRDGNDPFLVKRSINNYTFSNGQQGTVYFYILGSGGRKVKDELKGEYFVDGCYVAIDPAGHTRSDTISQIVIPVIPPETGDNDREDIKGQEKRK